MDLRLADGFSGDTQRVELPPGGSTSINLWVRNTGNATMDMAVFDFTGLEGFATREVLVYGLPVSGPVYIPEGYGIWNVAEAQFMFAIDIFPHAAFAIPLKEVKPRITKAESNIFLIYSENDIETS